MCRPPLQLGGSEGAQGVLRAVPLLLTVCVPTKALVRDQYNAVVGPQQRQVGSSVGGVCCTEGQVRARDHVLGAVHLWSIGASEQGSVEASGVDLGWVDRALDEVHVVREGGGVGGHTGGRQRAQQSIR